ncbi:MAG TPA: glycosyltransferase [Conexibacter sp.]|nr:glycosyltransferase [Conexibacter sp.]
MDPLVTCVVCAYNYAPYVERAVRSALGQQGLPDGALELIVIDDGSTDATPQLLTGFGDAITVIRQENQGPAVGTNRGIAAARGRFVALLDADDEWLPDRLARQLDVLERRPEVGLVHGDMEVIDGAGQRTRPSKYDWYGELPVVGRALGRLLAQNEATTSSITLRTEIAQAIPPAPAWAWCRDWWLAAHVAASHEIDALRAPVARYRIHGENVSAQDAASERAIRLWERDLRVRRILLRELALVNATLDELAVAWARYAGFLQRVAQARAIPQTDVVAVAAEDRAAAAELRAAAQELLAADPGAAGRVAVKAMAADPFEPASAALFEAARQAGADRPPTAAERERAFEELSEAVRTSDPARAQRHAARALMLDPADDHARCLLVGPAGPRARDEQQRAHFNRPAPRTLADARAFVALAFAEELIEQPALLRTWADAFGPDDDATLAIVTDAPEQLAAVHERLAAALAQARIAADDDHDLALTLAPAGSDAETGLARQAHALLSATAGPRSLGGHPRADADDAEKLRALAERRWLHDDHGAPLTVAIEICPQRWDGAERWGDTHFARALADELERRGHRARLEVVAEWDDPARPSADVTIHLRGLFPYVPRGGRDELNVLWNISHPDLVTAAECDAYDLVLTPSERHAEQLAARTRTPVAVLAQATDPVVFFPEADAAHARELVFVGNSRGVMRPILADLLEGREPVGDLAVWGQQWQGFLDPRLIAGEHLPNDAVRRAYSSAAIVLNDHWDDMRDQGIVSNRVYDALACGAVVLSDHLPELERRFGEAVVTYRTPAELHATVARLLADPAERAERAARGRAQVLAAHTFAHRVDALLAAIAAQRPSTTLKDARDRPILCS